MDLIKEIHQFLQSELSEMNNLILGCLSVEEELIQLIGNHISNSGGKRIRPVLTLLSTKLFDCGSDNAVKLGAAVEFIHMATLLHDDVVDGSKMRRFLPTANVIWGNKASILVGDFLFSQSFKLIVATRLLPAMDVLSKACAVVIEGEVSQLAKLEERRLITEEEYLKVINAKTAVLFGAACEVGAIIANQSPNYCNAMRNFGMKLGEIFQITDDLLDYFTQGEVRGKNIGDDFAEGKVTLPLIFLARKLPKNKKERLIELITAHERTSKDFHWVTDLLISFDIKNEILEYLEGFKISAYKCLEEINIQNETRGYLKSLVNFAVERSY
ncbi:MAG: polyprenyl synthetase family protein [Alphaproteobacteria bacterium]|nr:polyprenyl synthetase family protein [Alphaproteobacteria bacterium]NBY35312.1 polyprenyl synthetase family protein [Alphaproteobacteria bacterium]